MKKIILLTTVFFCFYQSGYCQSGKPDSTFGLNGSVTTNFTSLPGLTEYRSVAVQSDGKLVAAGFTQADNYNNLAIARYNINGTLDKSFSKDGKVTADSFTCVAMAIQNEKIIVAGSALARYNANGSLDSTFADNGRIKGLASVSAMAVQKNGKILALGYKGANHVLARFNNDGSTDNTFSGNGFTTIGNAQFILVKSDGKIITVGYFYSSDKGGSTFYITLNRYTPEGNLDSSFNQNGVVQYFPYDNWTNVTAAVLQNDGKIVVSGSNGFYMGLLRFNNDGSNDDSFHLQSSLLSNNVFALIIQNDGKIITGGSAFADNDGDFALERYNINGSVDSSFGKNGIQFTKVSGGFDVITSAAISGNKLYAAGSGDYYSNRTGAIAAYLQNGAPDSVFGTNGVAKTNFGSNRGSTSYKATAIQHNGKIVVAGTINTGNSLDFAVARYNTNGTLDKTFNDNGKQITSFGNNEFSSAVAVAIGNNGKIVVAGNTNDRSSYGVAVARYNNNGSADSTFNGTGRRLEKINEQNLFANSVAIQNDGKIVIAGSTEDNSFIPHFLILRYNTDGSADTDFDKKTNQAQAAIGIARAASVAIDPDGKIVVSGTATAVYPNGTHVEVVRYNTDGSLDVSFANGGIQNTKPGTAGSGSSLTLQADGKIVLSCNTPVIGSPNRTFFSVFRFNKDGTPDKSFDKDGLKQLFKSGYYVGSASSVSIQSDGKIFAGGFLSTVDNKFYDAFVSLNTDGSLNTAFSDDGMLTLNGTSSIGFGEIATSGEKFYYVSTTEKQYGIVSRYFLYNKIKTPPTVSLTTPLNDAAYLSGGNVYFTAVASDADGKIKNVAFYSDSALLYTATDTPYTFKWEHVLKGNYTLYAKATDNDGLVATSDSVHISVAPNKPPTVNIISPSNGQVFLTGDIVHLQANAFDADGRIIRVKFYNGDSLLTTEYRVPYTFDWRPGTTGSYTITAKATDNWGATTTSSPVNISVAPNQPPSVSLISPANGQIFTAPATINLQAAAQDTDGRIVQVSFYNRTILLTNTEHKLPYTYQWNNVPAGNYAITAVARDNWGAETISAPVTITVTAPPVKPIASSRPSSPDMKGDINNMVSVQLAPNPAHSILNINTTGLQNNQRSTISVLSASGVTFLTKQLNSSTQTIPLNISLLTDGMYIVKIVSGDRIIYKQFIKM